MTEGSNVCKEVISGGEEDVIVVDGNCVEIELESKLYDHLPRKPLLKLVHAHLLNKTVCASEKIGSDLYGVINIIQCDPKSVVKITGVTEVKYCCQHVLDEKMTTALFNEKASEVTKELIELLSKRLPGIDDSIRDICENLMHKIKLKINSREPSLVSTGLIFQGYSGSGKTTMLREFESFFQKRRLPVTYVNCTSLLSERKRGESLNVLESAIFGNQLESGLPCLVLLDNIDSIFHSSESSTGLSLTPTLLQAVDGLRLQTKYKGFIVASCEDASLVPDSLFRLARLGKPCDISYPSMAFRSSISSILLKKSFQIIERLLNSNKNPFNIIKNCKANEKENSIIDSLSNEIARRTQGYTVLDLISCIRYGLNYEEFLSCHGDVSKRTVYDFLDVIMTTKSSGTLASQSSLHIQNFSAANPPPTPVGFECIVDRIIQRTGCVKGSGSKASIRQMLGIKPCKGVVIYGPHGSGKTCIAKHVAYLCRHKFRFISVSCAELIHKVVGESEKRLAELFGMARSIAPCFLLLDNIEVILGSPYPINSSDGYRSRTAHKAIDRILSTLLIEIDGIKDPSNKSRHGEMPVEDQVIVIATMSNHPATLDSALTRPGRLEEHVELKLPSAGQRKEIVASYLCSNSDSETTECAIDCLVEATNGRTPAEIIQVIQESSMDTIRGIRQGGMSQSALLPSIPPDADEMICIRNKNLQTKFHKSASSIII